MMFVPIASFIAIKFITVLITKTALIKLLENTLDESLKLKNMSDKRLGCLMKSLLSQNFYRTMSDLSKTLILHPGFSSKVPVLNTFEKFLENICDRVHIQHSYKLSICALS